MDNEEDLQEIINGLRADEEPTKEELQKTIDDLRSDLRLRDEDVSCLEVEIVKLRREIARLRKENPDE